MRQLPLEPPASSVYAQTFNMSNIYLYTSPVLQCISTHILKIFRSELQPFPSAASELSEKLPAAAALALGLTRSLKERNRTQAVTDPTSD